LVLEPIGLDWIDPLFYPIHGIRTSQASADLLRFSGYVTGVLVKKTEIYVDRAFSEWDKARMSKHLQPASVDHKDTDLQVCGALRVPGLKLNSALLLALILSIIPTISGVALIA